MEKSPDRRQAAAAHTQRAGARPRRSRLWGAAACVPVLILITPLFNRAAPALLGLPFFYWAQLAFLLVGVASTAVACVGADAGPDEERPG